MLKKKYKKEKFQEKIAKEEIAPKEEIVTLNEDKSQEPFITQDNNLVEKILQNKFTIRNITYDKETGKRTFEFNAGKEEIEQYLKEGK